MIETPDNRNLIIEILFNFHSENIFLFMYLLYLYILLEKWHNR